MQTYDGSKDNAPEDARPCETGQLHNFDSGFYMVNQARREHRCRNCGLTVNVFPRKVAARAPAKAKRASKPKASPVAPIETERVTLTIDGRAFSYDVPRIWLLGAARSMGSPIDAVVHWHWQTMLSAH